jgi:hypothetical protein
MRRSLFCLFIGIYFQITSFAQKINYSIPEEYKNEISQEDYKKIIDISVPIVSKRYTIEVIEKGTMHLKDGVETQLLNLHNLIFQCISTKDKEKWERLIQDHFDNLFSSIDAKQEIKVDSFESIKKYLSIRIYPAAMVDNSGKLTSLIVRKDLEGTYTMLMLDLPGAFTNVQSKSFDIWKRDTAEVFNIAQENINRQDIQKVTRAFEMDGSNIEVSFLGNENYAASFALDLGRNSPELVGEWGSVVAIPNKGIVDICKISKGKPLDFVKFIQRIKPLVDKSYSEHPQPISNQYFWYYKGKFTRIKVISDATGNINVISPYGLSELMTKEK